MFDASGSAAALDSFQLIVALYLFYVAIKGSGTMYRFFDLPEEYQHKTRTPLRIIYAACGVLALLDAALSMLRSSMFTVAAADGASVVTQNYTIPALPFLSYSFIEIASSVLTGLIVAALCGVLIWLRILSKR